jgi:hypothetical protein
MAVSIPICNLALGDLRAPAIQDIDDESIEAQMCARYYQHCLDLMLDDYTWQFTKKIAALAEFSTNVRSTEWQYAYSLPDDCSQALRLIPSGQTVQWNYSDLTPPRWWYDFVVEGNVLYCNVADAVLEYSGNAADEADFPPMFREALRKLLAANLAVPIRDSRELESDLFKIAEQARQSAIANDMNRAPRTEIVDEVAWARR